VFEGREDSLKGNVYDIVNTNSSANAFITTTEEIAEFAGRTLKMGNYVKRSMEQMKMVTVSKPSKPPQDSKGVVDDIDQAIYKEEVKSYVIDKKLLESSMQKAYSIIYGQCSDGVRAKIEAMGNHIALSDAGDPIGLLKNIKTVMTNFQTTKYMPHAIYDCKRSLFLYRQDRDTSVPEYHKQFKSLVDVIEYNGGSLGADHGLIASKLKAAGANPDAPTEAQNKAATTEARDTTVACAFILGADKTRFGKLQEDLENAYTQGDDKYPTDLTEAYKLLTNWKQERRTHNPVVRRSDVAPDVAFTNIEEQMTFTNLGQNNSPTEHPGIQCYHCQRMGHYASSCTNERVERAPRARSENDTTGSDVQLLMSGVVEDDNGSEFSFHTDGHTRGKLPDSWILLDNQSTVHIFSNKKLLSDIKTVNRRVNVECNAGTTTTNMVGTLKGFGEVWYHPHGIANILSMALVEEMYPVTYTKAGGFVVHKTDGTIRRFVRSGRGLFVMDTKKNRKAEAAPDTPTKNSKTITWQDTTLVNTVANKKSNYTAKEFRMAELARKVQCMIGRPSLKDFLKIVDNNQLVNCPVTRRDVVAAEDIFGPDLGSLKGKTVRKSSPQLTPRRITLPPDVHNRNKSITLGIDIMFVNKVAFLITISQGLKFGTVEHINSRTQDVVLGCIKRLCSIYKLGGFDLAQINGDKEFGPLQASLADLKIGLNTASDDEHVGEIERYIRTVKERTRSIWNTLPFDKLPTRMIIELVKGSVSWLNMFPANDGISTMHSPRTIITGLQVDYKHHCRIEVGSYVQTHEQHDNTMRTRTIGAIALRPNGNSQGGYYFLSLSTGRRIDRQNWTELPMPNDVVDRVHTLARRDKAATGLTFGWRDGSSVTDHDNDDDHMADPDYDPGNDDDSDGDDDYIDHGDEDDEPAADDIDRAPIAGVADEDDEIVPPDDAHPHDDHPPHVSDADSDDDLVSLEPADEEGNGGSYDEHTAQPAVPTGVDDANPGVADAQPAVPTGVDGANPGVADGSEPPKRHGLRPKKAPNYDKHLGLNKPVDHGLMHANLKDLEHIALTQYSVKKGLQVFGEAGAEAVVKEMKQLDQLNVIEPRAASMLTRAEKKAALEYLMFLKQKRCGRIKGRGCADGRKQRVYMTKEETSSPTVTTEGLFLSCIIDAKEGRDVATTDIPGAFMQTDMDAVVHVRLSGPLAAMLVRVDPKKYKKYVVTENGKSVIYVRLLKALYGTMQASLLFWKDLTGELKKSGFVINPYDECVANKMVNGTQCTVLWHVDDLKISHIMSTVVDDILRMLDERYGKDAPLTTTRGHTHEYLGMTIDFSIKGKVMIRMDDYVDGILMNSREDMEGVATSPAAEHLFEVNDVDPDLLPTEDAQYFHTMTAKLLFLSKRARPDLQQAIAFLTTRVRKPDSDDYKKLGRVIKYLRGDPHVPLTLEADDARVMKWWVDASFAVHPDMKSHTGATASLGKGSVYSTSTRQKLNTKSSTEAELVAVDDVMPMILWTRYFLNAQGYKVNDSKIYQDNMSSILLEKNGRASSGKRTRHINIRYFFVADRVKSNEVSIEYCPTETMLADYLTKPLTGTKFRWFRNKVLNIQAQDDE
jgi:hypothetical protein